MDKYIGFDIDSKKTIACVVEAGKKDRFATFRTDINQMKEFLQGQRNPNGKIHLTFEISGEAGYRYDQLAGLVDEITVSNPTKMTWIYRSVKKNDRIDARKQAVLLSIGEVPRVHMPCIEVRQWRVTIQHRRKIVNSVTAVKNRIRAMLKSNGYLMPAVRGSWWKSGNRRWMKSIASPAPAPTLASQEEVGASRGGGSDYKITSSELWRMNLGDMLEELGLLESQLKRVTEYLDEYLKKQAGGTLLMSIPGVGPRTAEAVLAYTDDVRRFSRSKQYGAYFGLTPRLDESGTSRRLGHISKQGPSVVRWVIVESAWRVVKKSPALKAFYERVKAGQKGRKKIAIVAVARKLLCIMRAMMMTGELFNEELVGRECWMGRTDDVKRSA